MTPEEQRIAIAEACGWKWSIEGHWLNKDIPGKFHNRPDYLNDLNAMAEAEKTLKCFGSYVTVLCRVLGHSHDSAEAMEHCVRAPALRRAEAFLRTIGKWKD